MAHTQGEVECEMIGQYADIFWERLKVELPETMQEARVKELTFDPFPDVRPRLDSETDTVYWTR